MNESRSRLAAAGAALGLLLTAMAILADGTAADDSKAARLFLDNCAAKAESAKEMGVRGTDGWIFFKAELRHLGVGPFWGEAAEKASIAANPDARDPLPAIVHFKEQLDKLGIELILLPVPAKAIIYPDMLSEVVKPVDGQGPPRLDVNHQLFYKLLAEKGVKVVDLTEELLANRFDAAGPLYCKTDSHWSGLGCMRAAKRLAAELKDRPWLKDVPKIEFIGQDITIDIRGDLLADADKAEPEKLPIRLVGVRQADGKLASLPAGKSADSPVLVLSDSHGLVFHIGEDLFARNAGFVDQLAMELGFPVDLIGSRGDGATKVRVDLYQKARANPHWLKSKKVIIWCFSAREFTQCTNGWRKLPVTRD